MKTEKNIGFELRTISNSVKRRMEAYMQDKNYEKITGMQGFIIGFLYKNQDKNIFQKDIENELSARGSTVSAMLQTMEKNGLITRCGVKDDARLKKIMLTETAAKRHEYFEQCIQHIEYTMADGLSNEEMECFLRTLAKMKYNLEKTE